MESNTEATPPWSGVAILFFLTGIWHLTYIAEFLLLGVCISFFLKISLLSHTHYRALLKNREFKEIQKIREIRERPKLEMFVTTVSGLITGLISYGIKSLF